MLNNVVLSTNLSDFLEIYIHFSAWFSRLVRLVLEFHLSSTLVPGWERREKWQERGRREKFLFSLILATKTSDIGFYCLPWSEEFFYGGYRHKNNRVILVD